MTTTQVQYVLGKLGYAANVWTSLEDVVLINLAMVPRIFVDPKTMRFRFNTTTQNLEIVYGSIIDSVFTTEAGATIVNNYAAQTFVRFEILMSLHTSLVPNSFQGTYYQKSFTYKINYLTN